MKKFKYMIFECTDKTLSTYLNDAGNDGYELIQVLAFMLPVNGLTQRVGQMNMPVMETKFKCFFKKEITE